MSCARSNPRLVPRGFTLVEAVCTIAVLGVIGVLSSRLVFTASDQYLAAAARTMIGAEVSAAMERIAVELRQIPAKPGSNPTEAHLNAITPASVAWVDAAGESRALALSGTRLTISEGTVAYTLLDGVTTFSVQAFDESNNALATTLAPGATAAVRRIQVSIAVTRNGQTEMLRSRVFLRCAVEGGAP